MTDKAKTHSTAEFFKPSAEFSAQAHISPEQYRSLYQESVSNPKQFWERLARETLSWSTPFTQTLEGDFNTGSISWFGDGTLNISENCLDRHLATRGEKRAIIWEGNEPGEVKTLTYRELHQNVCRIANVLKKHGVTKGDRVGIYMPMVPELAATMLACARIGAIHTVVFAGFSADSLKGRLIDCQCSVVVTANIGLRGVKTIPLKETVDEALLGAPSVRTVLVLPRVAARATDSMVQGRDLWLDKEMASASTDCPAEPLEAEHPLFILYTSGSTGKPKGVLHTQAGYLLHAAITHKYVFDLREEDIHFCTADCGWVTGHSYVVYGPLANGATTVMFESIPTYPDAGRYWDTIDRHGVTIFYTAPTAIRALAKEGIQFVNQYKLSSLRLLGSVGEPINRDAWLWYHENIGKKRCPIVDTWWQTETGGVLISPLPGATPTKPGSATLPLFGVEPCLVDENGAEILGNGVSGRLCIKRPWPGIMRTVYGDHQRFIDTYLSTYRGMYFTGDGATRDKDGYYWITGRVDDVLNISGHRLGTAEIESAIVTSGIVAEAAVVGVPHDVKGQGICAFCILKDGAQPGEHAIKEIREAVKKVIGSIASPDIIQFVPGLPKTRSGKIMRRILRKIAHDEMDQIGDVSTLAEPAVVEAIVSSWRLRT